MNVRVSGWLGFYLAVIAVGAALVVLGNHPASAVTVALIAGAVIFRVGFGSLRALAQPVPEPPPRGELRKVKIQFRCTICGTEVRMTAANDEMPDPPRHCLEDMVLVTPAFD